MQRACAQRFFCVREDKMDDLSEALAVNFQVTEFPNNPHAPHPRFAQYKIKHNSADQNARRERLLEEQKLQRYKHVNSKRNIVLDEDEAEEPMQWQKSGVNTNKKRNKKNGNRLMLSEWLVDVPTDLAENWYFMLCPVGKRCLVTTNRGHTTAYSRSGHILKQFTSHLPGGNKQQERTRKDLTTLDCVFSDSEHTFYVLDIISWNGHPVYDSEVEFRFYWLRDKLSETPEINTQSRNNQFRFVPLDYFACSSSELSRVMTSPPPFSVELDGVLFYHKQSHYKSGSTPLVNWLKAYMVQEMLGVEVAEGYLKSRPVDYGGMAQLKEDISNKKNRKKKEVKMEL